MASLLTRHSPWFSPSSVSLPDMVDKENYEITHKTFNDNPSMQKKTQFSSLIYKSWPVFNKLPLAGISNGTVFNTLPLAGVSNSTSV
ncbi:hypothetical protein SLEP1_g57078 [Rubroshorea leprosula]|uniref:Uncharacterized protein n=1 Tax=Rubroshorea leprosula TaxID=152421 RepID=A0AAV5MKB3_9ROSI|nr:hypothetical protein SLEP1_g57078 [Rubroshorea leprosula]